MEDMKVRRRRNAESHSWLSMRQVREYDRMLLQFQLKRDEHFLAKEIGLYSDLKVVYD